MASGGGCGSVGGTWGRWRAVASAWRRWRRAGGRAAAAGGGAGSRGGGRRLPADAPVTAAARSCRIGVWGVESGEDLGFLSFRESQRCGFSLLSGNSLRSLTPHMSVTYLRGL